MHAGLSPGSASFANFHAAWLQGKHSPMRLPAAVEEFLKNEGIAFKKPQPGALEFSV